MFREFEGELMFVRVHEPDIRLKNDPADPDEYQWRASIVPTQESLLGIMDLQALGVKNKLKKDRDNRYIIQFSCPTERKDRKTGKVLRTFSAPTVYREDRKTPYTGEIENGTKGTMILEIYPHSTIGGGKAHAARLKSLIIKDKPKEEEVKEKVDF